MKIFVMTCGANVFLDDEDYERLDKVGWYLSPENRYDNSRGDAVKRKTRYAVHDDYGRMHRWVMGVTDPQILVDHIDGNDLNNQKSNLRLVTSGINKKNQKTIANNKFNFNGISYEAGADRIRTRWSEGEVEYKYGGYRAKQHSKNFPLKKYNHDYNLALKDAILFRIQKMKETEYLIDERSTTIEQILLKEDHPDMEKILGIDFNEVFK